MDLPIDLSEIVRIEVLEGPAGRIYGSSSLVGAVNIVTHVSRREECGGRSEITSSAEHADDTLPADFRSSIHPKHPGADEAFEPRPYYQVYRQKHGFLPNLSILDLLFNMGPEAIFYL
jgi:hypothetical protein